MPPVVSRLTTLLRSLNDASKLCFGAAAGFGIVGGSAWWAAFLAFDESRLSGLVWIGLFYLVLGWLEHLKATRSAVRITPQTTSDCESHREMTEELSTRKAA